MEFIASYWFVWLLGLIICTAFFAWRWFTTVLRTGGTILKMTTLTLESVEVAADKNKTVGEKAAHAKNRVVEEAAKEGASRLKEMGAGFVALILANIFGLLLIIAIICGLIDYFKQ